MLTWHTLVETSLPKKLVRLAKIICIYVVCIRAMMNELLKIQQDMGAPQQQHHHPQATARDEGDVGMIADPDDWVANLPKFGIYHRGYTTVHWLQVFRPL